MVLKRFDLAAAVVATVACSLPASAAVRYDFTALDTNVHDNVIGGAEMAGQLVVSVVPEPAVWATILVGLAILGATIRRRHIAIRRLREKVVVEEKTDDPKKAQE